MADEHLRRRAQERWVREAPLTEREYSAEYWGD
jgi:hypothetical protein